MSNEGLLAFLNGLGLPGIRKSPLDFTASYASATTLTLTGLPSVPQIWLGVWEIPVAGLPKFWTARNNAFSFVSATGVLTVAGASFVNTSTFAVLYADKHVAYDSVLDALQTVVMNAVQWDFVDSQTVLSAAALAAAVTLDTGWVYCKGETWLALQLVFTNGADAGNYVLSMGFFGNDTDAGTDEYALVRGDFAYPNGAIGGAIALDNATYYTLATAGAGTVTKVTVRVNVTGLVRFKAKFGTTTAPAANYGTLTCKVTEMNS